MGNKENKLETLWGLAMRGVERTFTAGWSLGEVAYSVRDPRALWRDPFRGTVLADIEKHGLYKTFPDEVQPMYLGRGGHIEAPNPYVRVGGEGPGKIVARMLRPKQTRQRKLLVVSHCYALPMPRLMEKLFNLSQLEGYDVVYNIMPHHYWGSFATWPGFGLMSVQMSRMIENIRAAVTGLRSLVRSLQASYGYEEVSLLGYSIGGQISLHVANCLPLDRLLLYCPVISVHETVTQLGLMPWMKRPMENTVRRVRKDFRMDDLEVLHPLHYELQMDPHRVLAVVQSYDAMVDPAQMRRMRDHYPSMDWLECPGTHTWPARLKQFHAAMRQHLMCDFDQEKTL